MRTINGTHLKEQMDVALRENWRADYVYAYPPRQSYYPLPAEAIATARSESLEHSGATNLYLHVPFCKQICAYCNLFAVAGSAGDDHARYVDLVKKELRSLHLPEDSGLTTVYIGGGTPSLMAPALIGELVSAAVASVGAERERVREVALEVAPDTIDAEKLAALRDVGINRINLGVQSWDDEQIHGFGRAHGNLTHEHALEAAMATGFDNVCVDLIYGLPDQSIESWIASLQAVIMHRPDTICCYALTLRPNTGYARKGLAEVDATAQYEKYDLACSLLADAGYVQETHVRWIVPGRGGYLQKARHWAGENIIGVGAGARSYLHHADLRNGYSSRSRRRVLRDWAHAVEAGDDAVRDGFLMNADERARKAIILGLGGLDRVAYTAAHGQDPAELFGDELGILYDQGLVEITPETIRWTDRGQRHRDVAVQLFFSEEVLRRVVDFDYASE